MHGPFGAESTTDEVLEGQDLRGKRYLVTGVSAGLGVETARALTAHGAEVVGTARSLDKARTATAGIGSLELVEMDLASLDSVRACADALVARGQPFDAVILNAGVMACPQGTTLDGFETQFGTNHLGHFLFANRILPLMPRGSRVVVLSSLAHKFSDVNIEDPNLERTPYNEWAAYGRSKTANVLFAVEFDRRHRDRGIRATAVHPGSIQTELTRHLDPERMRAASSGGKPIDMKTVPQGAATSVWAAVVADAEDVGGRYCENCHVAEINDEQGERHGVRPYAIDAERARALWVKSEDMVGERF